MMSTHQVADSWRGCQVIAVICVLVWLINIPRFNDPLHGSWVRSSRPLIGRMHETGCEGCRHRSAHGWGAKALLCLPSWGLGFWIQDCISGCRACTLNPGPLQHGGLKQGVG